MHRSITVLVGPPTKRKHTRESLSLNNIILLALRQIVLFVVRTDARGVISFFTASIFFALNHGGSALFVETGSDLGGIKTTLHDDYMMRASLSVMCLIGDTAR